MRELDFASKSDRSQPIRSMRVCVCVQPKNPIRQPSPRFHRSNELQICNMQIQNIMWPTYSGHMTNLLHRPSIKGDPRQALGLHSSVGARGEKKKNLHSTRVKDRKSSSTIFRCRRVDAGEKESWHQSLNFIGTSLQSRGIVCRLPLHLFRPNRAIADLIDLALWHERAAGRRISSPGFCEQSCA